MRRKPRKGFESSELDLTEIAPGQIWRRLYRSIYPNPLGYGLAPSRFSDPRLDRPEVARFGVLYLGSSLKVCFLETMLRDRRNGALGDVPIPFTELQRWNCADIAVVSPLKLVDLRKDGAVRMGIPTDAVRASAHRLGQDWALAFWSHTETPDGIIYPSRLNEETNIALFDRAIFKVRVEAVRPLLDSRAEMADLFRTYRLAIV
ncbi:MAG: RES family NAD+ phosphorylase [Aliidongia sp.]